MFSLDLDLCIEFEGFIAKVLLSVHCTVISTLLMTTMKDMIATSGGSNVLGPY